MNKISALCFILAAMLLVSCTAPASEISLATIDATSISQPTSVQSTPMETSQSVSASESVVPIPFDSPRLWESPYPEALVGNWHGLYMVPAGYCDRWIFDASGKFYFAANQMTMGERLRYMDGEWHFEDGIVYLTIMRKAVMEGGTVTDGWGSLLSDIEGGELVKYVLAEKDYIFQEFPVEIATNDEEWEMLDFQAKLPTIMFGEQQLWKLPSVDYSDILAEAQKFAE